MKVATPPPSVLQQSKKGSRVFGWDGGDGAVVRAGSRVECSRRIPPSDSHIRPTGIPKKECLQGVCKVSGKLAKELKTTSSVPPSHQIALNRLAGRGT